MQNKSPKKSYEAPKISVVGGVSDFTQAMMMGVYNDAMGRLTFMNMGIS